MVVSTIIIQKILLVINKLGETQVFKFRLDLFKKMYYNTTQSYKGAKICVCSSMFLTFRA